MDLELPYGPWKKLSFGEWGDFPTGVYVNQDKLLLLAVFEKHGGEVTGVLTVVKKAFVTDADLSKAARAQRREFTVVEKHSQEGSERFVLVSSTPLYSKYSQPALVEALGRQVNELKAMSKGVEELAEAYNTSARDLAQASEEQAQALLGDPFLLMAMLQPGGKVPESPAREQRVAIGLNAAGELVSIPLSALSAAVVVGGTREDRLHAAHVLCEAALTNSVACIVFDSSNSFTGLAQPNKNTRDFTRHRMTAMPLGFPYRDYKLGSGFYVDLALVDEKLFLQTLGLADSPAGKAIAAAWDGKEKHSIPDLVESVGKLSEGKDFTAYDVSKAVRALRVVERSLPGIFSKLIENDLLVPWHDGIGRVFHVNASGFGEAAQHLAISSLLRAMPLEKNNRRLRGLIAFEDDITEVYGDVLELVSNARESGMGFVLHAEHELDLKLVDKPSIKLELVGSEAVASLEGEKPMRFTLRPTYSECSERMLKAG